MLVITIRVRPYVLREECNLVCHCDHVSRVSGGFSKRRKRRKESKAAAESTLRMNNERAARVKRKSGD